MFNFNTNSDKLVKFLEKYLLYKIKLVSVYNMAIKQAEKKVNAYST